MAASLSPGARLGPYQIVEALGSGGMGEVYLARDTRLDRQVALKIISPAVADDPERLRRFVREAKTASALNHPNIAHVYEIGEADGTRFLVMEYVQGTPLDRRIGTRGIPPAEALAIATQIADALDEAHHHGVVHRDLKPANVMLTPRGRVKVLDFGLAKVMPAPDARGDGVTTAATDTTVGLVLGTLDYMSPEQVRGLDIDRRTDIFSFGVLLYQMVTGRLPFASTSRTDTVYRITQSQPEALSRFAYDVPPDLERIVRRCMEKDPSRRYQSAHDVLLELSHVRPDGSGVVEATMAPVTPRVTWRGVGTAMLTLIVGVVLGGLATAWLLRDRLDVIESIAVVPHLASEAPGETGKLAEALATALHNSLTQLPNVRVAPRQLAFSAGRSLSDPQAIAARLGVHAVLLIEVEPGSHPAAVDMQLVDAEHSTALWGKEYQRDLGEIELARETISDEVWNELRLRLNAEDRQALEVFQLYQRGRNLAERRREADLRRAIELYDQALVRDRNHALSLAGKAQALNLLQAYALARPEEAYPQAKAAAQRAIAIDDSLADAHTNLAWVFYRWDWDFPAAEREFVRAMDLDPEYPQARHWAAMFKGAMGKFDEAQALIREAQVLDPLTFAYRSDEAWVLFMAGRFSEAVTSALEATRFGARGFQAHRYLGMAYTMLGDFEPAIAAYREAIRLEGGNSALLNGELAHTYARAGRRDDAGRQLADLLTRKTRNAYVSPYVLALIYTGAGDHAQAFEWLIAAFRERDNQTTWIKVDPRLDPLRRDPRFADLLARMKLD